MNPYRHVRFTACAVTWCSAPAQDSAAAEAAEALLTSAAVVDLAVPGGALLYASRGLEQLAGVRLGSGSGQGPGRGGAGLGALLEQGAGSEALRAAARSGEPGGATVALMRPDGSRRARRLPLEAIEVAGGGRVPGDVKAGVGPFVLHTSSQASALLSCPAPKHITCQVRLNTIEKARCSTIVPCAHACSGGCGHTRPSAGQGQLRGELPAGPAWPERRAAVPPHLPPARAATAATARRRSCGT